MTFGTKRAAGLVFSFVEWFGGGARRIACVGTERRLEIRAA
jgi:hypothetical protein